jgi:hypothetical protein
MRLNVFRAMTACLAIVLASSIGSQKLFAQTAQPSADSTPAAGTQQTGKPLAEKLPAGYTIPPQDVPCILPGNRVDIQCLIKNDPDFARVRAEEAGLEAQAQSAQSFTS